MFGNISWPQLLIILVIVLAIFGTKRLRTLGSDLGSAASSSGARRSPPRLPCPPDPAPRSLAPAFRILPLLPQEGLGSSMIPQVFVP